MYLIRKDLGLGYHDIGAYFNGRDHTSVLHACKKIEARFADDPTLQEALSEIRKLAQIDSPENLPG